MGNGERFVWGESAGKTELIRFGEVHGILDDARRPLRFRTTD